MIYWFTGQPGSGKTTLANELHNHLSKNSNNVFQIDGDKLRELFPNKDYSRVGREKNIQLAMDIAKYLDSQSTNVIVSLVSPYRNMRENLKSECNVVEIYCHTTDIRGRESYFVEDYEPPIENFIDIDTTNDYIEESLLKIINKISV